ncbi:sce7726 family protein [Sinorhizobium medicae]|uniref:sce7726 family protein n=1 Tax=Sinorhizobium medicae TaxID=110321 RepID=UPI00041CFE44|nr:sce7726 family protein [Sinorhizobium medicae]
MSNRRNPDSLSAVSALKRASIAHSVAVQLGGKNIYKSMQLSALTRLFSATVFREMAKKGQSGLFRRLVEQADLSTRAEPLATVGDAFDSAFETLKVAGHRDEYIYRAAITHKVLMGTHSLRTASMLNEFRAATSKADLVILNGTATVYEIKSERDSLARLANQVENYKRVFAKVNVIASEGHIEGVLATVPDDVGVMCLSKRYRITTLRESIDCPSRICPVTVFESLRMGEAVAILNAMGVTVPQIPNTQRHAAMRDLFAVLDPAALHVEMVRTLKRTRDLAPLGELIDLLPASLQAAALSISVRRADHPRLIEAVTTPLHAAMTWS